MHKGRLNKTDLIKIKELEKNSWGKSQLVARSYFYMLTGFIRSCLSLYLYVLGNIYIIL